MARKNDRKPVRERARKVVSFVKEDVWKLDLDRLSGLKRFGVLFFRFVSIVNKGFSSNRCALHAAGLTYFSILTVIPVLMLTLILTKPCGMYEWSRERIRVNSDEMIASFFEKQQPEESAPAAKAAPPSTTPPAESASAPREASGAPPEDAVCAEDAGKVFGQQARELRDRILAQIDEKIEGFNFGLMALVGFGALAWTVVKMFGQVETSINEVWNVERDRPVWRKVYLYVSAVMLLPLLSGLAMSLPILRVVKDTLDATLGSAACTKWMGDALVSVVDSSFFSIFVSLLFTTLAFTFIFKAMPNRKVETRAAFRGGLVTALLFGVWVRACAGLQVGIANSSAAYGSFALVPILIVWINMSWTIILLGSNMAYAFQCIRLRVRGLPRE